MLNLLYRCGSILHKWKIPGGVFFFKALIRLLCNSAVDPRTHIGKGTLFAYGGIAVVIHRHARIGSNVVISQCVTIGGRSGHDKLPVIEDNVYIGAGAIIIGPVNIGHGSIIGAGSVVIDNVESGEVWAGVPAKKIKDNNEYTIEKR